jgi:hypothetical protein
MYVINNELIYSWQNNEHVSSEVSNACKVVLSELAYVQQLYVSQKEAQNILCENNSRYKYCRNRKLTAPAR